MDSDFQETQALELEQAHLLIDDVRSELHRAYPFLKKWTVTFDRAKRRAGVCRPEFKRIAISEWHIKNNCIEVVKDTVLHEFAHAIAFEVHQDLTHGPVWKQIAKRVGATPKSTGRFSVPESPWMLVTYCSNTKTVEKIAPRYRKNKRIRDYFLRGRPDTQGKLFYLSTRDLERFESETLKFEDLQFIQ